MALRTNVFARNKIQEDDWSTKRKDWINLFFGNNYFSDDLIKKTWNKFIETTIGIATTGVSRKEDAFHTLLVFVNLFSVSDAHTLPKNFDNKKVEEIRKKISNLSSLIRIWNEWLLGRIDLSRDETTILFDNWILIRDFAIRLYNKEIVKDFEYFNEINQFINKMLEMLVIRVDEAIKLAQYELSENDIKKIQDKVKPVELQNKTKPVELKDDELNKHFNGELLKLQRLINRSRQELESKISILTKPEDKYKKTLLKGVARSNSSPLLENYYAALKDYQVTFSALNDCREKLNESSISKNLREDKDLNGFEIVSCKVELSQNSENEINELIKSSQEKEIELFLASQTLSQAKTALKNWVDHPDSVFKKDQTNHFTLSDLEAYVIVASYSYDSKEERMLEFEKIQSIFQCIMQNMDDKLRGFDQKRSVVKTLKTKFSDSIHALFNDKILSTKMTLQNTKKILDIILVHFTNETNHIFTINPVKKTR